MRAFFVPVNTGRDESIRPVFVSDPFFRPGEEFCLLLWTGLFPPVGRSGHHVLDGQHCILAAPLWEHFPQSAHRLVGVRCGQVLVLRGQLRVGIRGVALAIAVPERRRDGAHARKFLAPHDCVHLLLPPAGHSEKNECTH